MHIGVTLKQIRDQTNVKIDIPRRDALTANGNGNLDAGSPYASGSVSPAPADDDDEPTVPITITGPQPLANEAQDLIKQIIASKRARTTQHVRDIPSHIVPFVKARRSVFVEAAEGGDVELSLRSAEREVTVSGDRETVLRVIEAIKATITAVTASLTSLKIQLPKRQHRLLVGNAVNEILASSKCVVSAPPPEDISEDIFVWGQAEDLGNGVAAVMSRANSQYIHEFPLPGPIALSRQLLTYINHIGYPRTLAAAHPGVSVFTPESTAKSQATVLNVDLVGEKALVDAAVRQVSELMGKLIGATKDVQVDWLVHRVIQGKHAKKSLPSFHASSQPDLFCAAGLSSTTSRITFCFSSLWNPRSALQSCWYTTRLHHPLLRLLSRKLRMLTKSRKNCLSGPKMRQMSRARPFRLQRSGTAPLSVTVEPHSMRESSCVLSS